jgi:hypothetical protein
MSLIVKDEIIRLDSVYKLTLSKYNTYIDSKFIGGEIYVHYKSADKEDKRLYYMFKCLDKPGIIEQIKKDVSMIFASPGVYNMQEMVDKSIQDFYEKSVEKEFFDSAKKSLENKIERPPTNEEVLQEAEVIKFMCMPKPVG